MLRFKSQSADLQGKGTMQWSLHNPGEAELVEYLSSVQLLTLCHDYGPIISHSYANYTAPSQLLRPRPGRPITVVSLFPSPSVESV